MIRQNEIKGQEAERWSFAFLPLCGIVKNCMYDIDMSIQGNRHVVAL
jgi:hypothetical protein